MLNVQVKAYRRQTVSDWGVVRSCDPLQNFGAPIISLERLNLKSSNFVQEYAISILCNRMTYHQQKGRGYGHVIVLKFCRLSWCSASRGFVSDCWATCSLHQKNKFNLTVNITEEIWQVVLVLRLVVHVLAYMQSTWCEYAKYLNWR